MFCDAVCAVLRGSTDPAYCVSLIFDLLSPHDGFCAPQVRADIVGKYSSSIF